MVTVLLSIVMTFLVGVSLLFISYFVIFSFLGFFKVKRKYEIIEDKTKFCIFVPCHNEEDIIAATVRNLGRINYNKDLFDIFFIADNCKDKTAEETRKVISEMNLTNFKVFERFETDPNKKGKPHALRWGMDLLESYNQFYQKYDMFMVFDADNFADSDILKHFNSQYFSYKEEDRPDLIQAYLDSKNANNIIAKGYNVSYRISNRFFQLPKSRLGLNCTIGGTGYAITTTFLKELGGFSAVSLTEDLEIQTIATIKGKFIAYNHHARIYDEKPTGVKQSFIQKTRWAQGHWWNCINHSKELVLSMRKSKNARIFFSKIDNLVYLFAMANYAVASVTILLNVILALAELIFNFKISTYLPPMASYIFLIITLYQSIIVIITAFYMDGTAREKKEILLQLPIHFISVTISGIIFSFASVNGLLKSKNQKVWAKTKHIVTDLDEKNNSNTFKEIVSLEEKKTVSLEKIEEVTIEVKEEEEKELEEVR